MIPTLERFDPATLGAFDDIIDVRSPAEFAEDHVPGAINLPVLDDDERARIGTIYVQESRFLARRIGAALVARNIADHLDEALKDKRSSYAPLIYCWRGGQRSNAMATVLSQVGWRPTLLAGGYRTYRRRVTAALYDTPAAFAVVLLDGFTGSAKTEILGRLADLGAQILDLEGLAGHRGSLFGGHAARPQPSQKLFESRLLAAMEALDPARPVVVEAESSKIGEINLPPGLWKTMLAAPRMEISAPRAERARYLTAANGDIAVDAEALVGALAKLPRHHSAEQRAAWRTMAEAKDFIALAESLIEHHYDPAYERSRRRDARPLLGVVTAPTLDPADLEQAARMIAEVVSTVGERATSPTHFPTLGPP